MRRFGTLTTLMRVCEVGPPYEAADRSDGEDRVSARKRGTVRSRAESMKAGLVGGPPTSLGHWAPTVSNGDWMSVHSPDCQES